MATTAPQPADEPARPMRADARRNREKVLAAAKAAFAAAGPDAQMDDIARRAGVGVGTVYRHFPTKEALLSGLVRLKFAGLVAQAREAVALDADDALFHFLANTAEEMSRDAAFQHTLMFAGAPWDAAEEERRELTELAGELIARGQRAGLVRADMRVPDIPLLMGGLCTSMATEVVPHADWRRHLELVLDAVRAAR